MVVEPRDMGTTPAAHKQTCFLTLTSQGVILGTDDPQTNQDLPAHTA